MLQFALSLCKRAPAKLSRGRDPARRHGVPAWAHTGAASHKGTPVSVSALNLNKTYKKIYVRVCVCVHRYMKKYFSWKTSGNFFPQYFLLVFYSQFQKKLAKKYTLVDFLLE